MTNKKSKDHPFGKFYNPTRVGKHHEVRFSSSSHGSQYEPRDYWSGYNRKTKSSAGSTELSKKRAIASIKMESDYEDSPANKALKRKIK